MATSIDHDPASSSKLRAGVFSRESKGKGSSIEDQERENLDACEGLGAEVVVRLTDKVGASRFTTKERVGWPEITELVRSGQIDLLVVWEVSRADRKMDTWVPFITTCESNHVRLHITSLEMTYDPRKAAHRKALMDMGSSAEAETGTLSERTRKGTLGAALAGKGHGRPAYGFTRMYDALDRKQFREFPNDKIGIAVEIIERVAAEEPLKRIKDDLNKRNLGRTFSHETIKYIATNPAYIGKRRHQGKLYDASWDAVVDEEVFNRAGEVLGAEDRRKAPPGATRYLLSYLATPHCKGELNVQPARGVCASCETKGCPEDPCKGCGGTEWRDVRKARYRCLTDACVSIDLDVLDTYVTAVLLRRLAREDAKTVFAGNDEAAKAARKKIKAAEQELAELVELGEKGTENGGLSPAMVAKLEPAIRKRLEDAQAEYARHARSVVLDRLIHADDAKAEWKRLSVAAQRSVIKTLFGKIELGPNPGKQLSRWASYKDQLERCRDRTVIEWV